MKTFGIAIVLLLAGLLLGGCETPGESASERSLRIRRVSDQNWRMFVDDWDYFWLVDRSSRLTRYHVDVGY